MLTRFQEWNRTHAWWARRRSSCSLIVFVLKRRTKRLKQPVDNMTNEDRFTGKNILYNSFCLTFWPPREYFPKNFKPFLKITFVKLMLEAKSAQVVGLLNQKKEIKTLFNVDFLVNHFCVCLFPCYCLLGTLSCWPFALMWVWNPERSCQPGSISKSVQNEMLMLTSLSVYPNDSLMWNNFYWMCIDMEVHSKGRRVFS